MKGLCIAIVSENVAKDPNLSILRRSQEFGLSNLHPYKDQLTQQLKAADHSQRRRYVVWVLEQQAVGRNFSNTIFFSDEGHFTLGGYVNKQNSRIWRSKDPQVTQERSLHPEKVTVWCAL